MTIKHSNPIHPASKVGIPDEAVYDIPPSAIAQRSTAESYPVNGGSSSTYSDTSNRVMQFYLPSTDQLLDTKSSMYLQFTASASGTGAYLDLVGSSASKFFDRLRVYTSSGADLEDINGYSNLSQWLGDLLPADAQNSALNASGSGYFATTSEASSASSSGNAVFTLNLNSGLLQNNKWIPLEFTDGLYIELTMAPASQIVRTSAGTGSYSVTNSRLTYDLVRLDSSVHDQMRAHWKEKGIKLYYSSWQHHPRVVQSGNTRETISITDRSRSARSIVLTQRASANQNSHQANGYERTRNNLSSYQLKIGSSYQPAQPVRFLTNDSCASAWKRVEQTFPSLAKTANIKNSDFVNNKFMIAEKLEAVDSHISGSQHADDVQPIEVLMEFSSGTAQAQVDVYIQHDVVVELSPAGVRKFD